MVIILGVIAASAVTTISGEEIVGRELDFRKYVAGSLARVFALLFGYAEVVYRN